MGGSKFTMEVQHGENGESGCGYCIDTLTAIISLDEL